MDVPQLKLLAGLVRGLLEQHNVPVGHSQSLDLIAALPGLRNWPEVNAFPDRVAACVLDSASASRLAFRLKSKHSVVYSSQGLVEALSPPAASRAETGRAPKVWPSGPTPGVYVTTSQEAINALLQQYEEATDGELVYAEAAGSRWEGSIDLGEYGLSSNGLSRVPSGTLLVVGPLELNQQSWEASSAKLEWACMHAQMSGHRVAVLIDTPTPELMFKDIEVMVRQASPAGDDCYKPWRSPELTRGTAQQIDPPSRARGGLMALMARSHRRQAGRGRIPRAAVLTRAQIAAAGWFDPRRLVLGLGAPAPPHSRVEDAALTGRHL